MPATKPLLRLGLLAAIGALLLQACNRGQLPVTPLKYTDLPQASFQIRSDRDTVLRTPGGATLRIAAGTIIPESGAIGEIRIREAYTPGQMLRGGLVTMSGSDIMSSGGMISIEPGPGTKRELNRPIRISIPTTESRGGMQLWSGNADSAGKVDWQDPQPLVNDSTAYRAGKVLFNQNCASCHRTSGDATGPGLGDMLETRDWEWLKAFTRNPAGMVASGDILANASLCKFQSMMTAFPSLSDSELHAIFTFAAMDAGRSSATRPDARASVDSCRAFLARRGLSLESRPSYSGPDAGTQPAEPAAAAGIAPEANAFASSYEVSVRRYGWYNVDILLKDLEGFENSTVLATFSGQRRQGISVYLIMPEDNILLEGGPSTGGGGSYAFYRNDGTVPLRPGSRCIAAGVADSGGKWFFAMQEFTAKSSQEIGMELRPLSKDSLNAILDRMVGKGAPPSLSASVPVEALKPKNIACGCR